VQRAKQLYGQVSNQPFVNSSVWFTDVYEQYISRAVTSLPEGGVADDQTSGVQRDLWETAKVLLAEMRSQAG
jgi:hypothetical protein